MLTFPVTSSRFVVFIYPPCQDNRIREVKFLLTTTGQDEKQNKIICNEKEKALDWSSGIEGFKDAFEILDELIYRKRYRQASKEIYFLTKGLLANSNGIINGQLLREIFLKLSIVAQKQHNWEDALSYSLFASELDPESARAHEYVANCCRRSNKPIEAVQYAEQAVFDHETNSSSRVALASAYRTYSMPEIALEHARKAVKLDRHRASTYIALAEVFIDLDDHHRASGVLKTGFKNLTAHEYNYLLYFKRGLERSGRFEDRPEIVERYYKFAA